MVKEYYFIRTVCGGAKLTFIGDSDDIEDFEKIREYVRHMNEGKDTQEYKGCNEIKNDNKIWY